MKVVVTGTRGLLGWHSLAALHAKNCAARFKGEDIPFQVVDLNREAFNHEETLKQAFRNADVILHFAGVNRGTDQEIADGNPQIAQQLVEACKSTKSDPHIVYANSIHADADNIYGRSKKQAEVCIARFTNKFTNLILPHVFGEGARPFYNNVTGTLIHQICNDLPSDINPKGFVDLVHAGVVADACLQAMQNSTFGSVKLGSNSMPVIDLYEKLKSFHESYEKNIYPKFFSDFEVQLFNAYRFQTYPDQWPRNLNLNEDSRGNLFEAVKGGSGGQVFLSTTVPGITRGDHFHRQKVERFLVLKGQATIRLRKVFDNVVHTFSVSGDNPQFVDMPTLYTHSIENVGEEELLTLFWTNEIFDPSNPDTYADKVLR